MDGSTEAYRVLQVDAKAQQTVIKAAFQALARRYHPDGGREPDPVRMAVINRAYALLRDPESRRRYDLARAQHRSQPIPVSAPPRFSASSGRHDIEDRVVLDFGRYAGWAISDLAGHDPDYLRWLCRHSSGIRFREAITKLLPREPDLMRRANSVA